MTDQFIPTIVSNITAMLNSTFMLSSSRHYWLYMLCYLLVAVALYLMAKNASHATTDHTRKNSFLSFLFPKQIYTHPSLLLDFKIWLVVALIVKLGLFGLIYTSVGIISGLIESLIDLLGPAWRANRIAEAPTVGDRIFYTIVLTCCIDFGFFIMHYCQHKISWLWAFHRVHHSAEVLTPVTANRHHPVDYIIEASMAILLGAIGTIVFTRWHGTEIDRLTLLNTSAIHCVYYMTANVRHSHLWLHFGKLPCQIFVSPAMHQIHHSIDARHYNKNFGFVFSFWDALFRCRYIPEQKEPLTFGLHNNEPGYKGLADAMIRPFKESFKAMAQPRHWGRKSPFKNPKPESQA